MPSAADLAPDGRFMGLFVSQSGAGKTCAACSFMEDEAVYAARKGYTEKTPTVQVFDFDGRIRGLLGAPWINRKRITYNYYPPKAASGNPTYVKVNSDLEALQYECQKGTNTIETVVLDSITSETYAMVCDALPLTHANEGNNRAARKGKFIGNQPMPGPEDYGFEAQATYNILSFFRSIPIKNVIITAHLVDTFGKEDEDDDYSATVKKGEKLSVRDKIGTNVMIYFDHVFRFEKSENGKNHFVQFKSGIARTSYSGLPDGKIDITNKNFYKYLLEKTGGMNR